MSRIEIIDETGSTNSLLAASAPELEHGHVLMARRQTAGRGQRGNTWEAAPGLNVTMSLLVKPGSLDVRHQFSLSEAVALGVVRALGRYAISATVKWPNDIYVDDRKICGILIENSIEGTLVGRSIAGIGLNVNQREFVSPAPNPVSMWQLLGTEHDVEQVARTVTDEIMKLCDTYLATTDARATLHSLYMDRLWRNDNVMHPYIDSATGVRFMAAIADVAPTGHLTLRDEAGVMRTYAFKEVQAALH